MNKLITILLKILILMNVMNSIKLSLPPTTSKPIIIIKTIIIKILLLKIIKILKMIIIMIKIIIIIKEQVLWQLNHNI